MRFGTKRDFRDCLKESKISPGLRNPGGRSFHSLGPAAVKLLSPSLSCAWCGLVASPHDRIWHSVP